MIRVKRGKVANASERHRLEHMHSVGCIRLGMRRHRSLKIANHNKAEVDTEFNDACSISAASSKYLPQRNPWISLMKAQCGMGIFDHAEGGRPPHRG